MATLRAVWLARTEMYRVARRTGNPGIYVALGRNTARQALLDAINKQQIDLDDLTADDWYEADG